MDLQYQVSVYLLLGFTISDKSDVVILTVVIVIISIILFALNVALYEVFLISFHIRNNLLQYL